MESARILVATDNEISYNKLKTVLIRNGYLVIDQARDGNECLRKMINLKPDLAVIEYNLTPQKCLEIAKIAIEDRLCDIILLVSNEQKNEIEFIKPGYDFAIVTTPLNAEILVSTVDIVIRNRRKIIKLEKEIEVLKNTLESRKEIDKAKGLLMQHLKLSEEQAFRVIQKQSMDRGMQMKEIAKAIISAYNLLI